MDVLWLLLFSVLAAFLERLNVSAAALTSEHIDLQIIPMPPVKPGPKRVLFASKFYTNTEINQMLEVAEELKIRGHKCSFVCLEEFQKKVTKRGFEFHGIQDPLKKPGQSHKFISAVEKMQLASTWFSYIRAFFDVVDVTSDLYEPALIVLNNVIDTEKPDLIYASMFDDVAIDLAVYHDIPLVVNYAAPLGSMFDYEDLAAAPDGFLWGTIEEHLTLWHRLRKYVRLIMVISGTTGSSSKVNAIREKYDIPAINDPLTNWKRAAVVVSFPFGIQIARPLRPLTYVV
mmetsp:Transcript_23259/g.28631  ORF Transcript_23259/g.28631 Transcript_23259/m.28631 type:complete len:287 (+) Transcript_23259:157-1017(+)